MFKKLLKHDFRAVGRGWWIIGLTLLAAFFFCTLGFRIGIDSFMEMILWSEDATVSSDGTLEVLSAMFGMLLVMASYLGFLFITSAGAIGTEIMIYWRFYKHLYTDEGYLTFTLPVSRKQILRSKTVNALIWECILLAVCTVGVLFMLLIVPPMENGGFGINPIVYTSIFGTALPAAWEAIGGWIIVFILMLVPLSLLSMIASVSIIQFCITLGSVIVKKFKLLAAIGVYYVVNTVVSVVAYVVYWFAAIFMSTGIATFFETASTNVICATVTLFMLIVCTILASFAAVFYFATRNLLERKLNLA